MNIRNEVAHAHTAADTAHQAPLLVVSLLLLPAGVLGAGVGAGAAGAAARHGHGDGQNWRHCPASRCLYNPFARALNGNAFGGLNASGLSSIPLPLLWDRALSVDILSGLGDRLRAPLSR